MGQADFDAIKMLSDLGIIVVETGGNGNEDLDSAPMMGRFDRAVRDSGAIVVGAGDSATRTALNFSSHGTRVDLQGWGNNITTTGGNGNLQGGTAAANVLRRYTRTFGGTSGAGPIVTNAVVAVQSYLKATGQGVYTARQLTDLLRRTGTPQTGTRLVGPLPNVAAALREIEVDPPVTSASFSPAGVNGWYLNPVVSLSADDRWGVGVDRIEYRLDGGAWTPYTGPFQVLTPNGHTLELRSFDKRGNAERGNVVEFNVYDLETPVSGSAGAAVPATLSLTLGGAAGFGAFTPGIAREYTATTTACVISSAGDATLSVSDPSVADRGRLVNGAFVLGDPLLAMASSSGGTGSGTFAPLGDGLSLLTYSGPVSNDAVSIAFRQRIAASQALRTGAYRKTLTFTLSTTTP